ncbi:hypothetical protein OPT61_g8790 [Boeremia exigua]|uniref:Uncharacterized protein n=1 Tax=Boeremia exigua TaxID=749465 RepID=A0ACC2HXU2_9PLEO|nr:hypothetical protein OPT61_g8790 [Boeremia exigua]
MNTTHSPVIQATTVTSGNGCKRQHERLRSNAVRPLQPWESRGRPWCRVVGLCEHHGDLGSQTMTLLGHNIAIDSNVVTGELNLGGPKREVYPLAVVRAYDQGLGRKQYTRNFLYLKLPTPVPTSTSISPLFKLPPYRFLTSKHTMASRSVLVTGGTGYIGSFTALALLEAGYKVVIVDNLYNSSKEVINRIELICGKRPEFYELDIQDEAALDKVFKEHPDIDNVIHFAALKVSTL